MKNLTAEQKAKKATYNKEYAAKKKAKAQTPDWMALDKFEKAFDYKIRLYKNLKMEISNSYNASPGAVLSFVKISNANNLTTYRVKRTGRRTFYTTSNELAPAK